MSDRGWWTDSRTKRFPLARRDRVMTRLWAVKLSKPEVGSSRIKIPAGRWKKINLVKQNKLCRYTTCCITQAIHVHESHFIMKNVRNSHGFQIWFTFMFLTGVPEKLHGYTDSPSLSSRNPPHIVIAHPGVCTLTQSQLSDDIIHLWQTTSRICVIRNIVSLYKCRLWHDFVLKSLQSHSLVPLSLCEESGEPQLGHEAEGLTDGEVRKKTVVLADVSDVFLDQLWGVGLPINQNLTGCHCSSFVPTSYDIQQRRLTTAWRRTRPR